MTDANIKAQIDERRIARGIALGLPLVTVVIAFAVGTTLGVSLAVLVLAAGVMLGAIALFWASIRVLSGDAALPPEIEALDMTAHGVDALASRKKMLLLALKDLQGEHEVGKLDDEDYEQISATYRAELKDVMRRIDETLEPYRAKAAEAARAHLATVGLAETGYRGELPGSDTPALAKTQESAKRADDAVRVGKAKVEIESIADALAKGEAVAEGTLDDEKVGVVLGEVRVACSKCKASNETDAKFCKSCGASLAEGR